MAPDSANGFFVTEYYGNTVSHVTVDLNGVSADYNFGSGPGSAAGQLSSPDSIRRIPATGRLVISNPPNGRIDEFSPTGAYERSYGFGVLTGSDKFETCGVGIGACQAGVPYQSDPRSYFTQVWVRLLYASSGHLGLVTASGNARRRSRAPFRAKHESVDLVALISERCCASRLSICAARMPPGRSRSGPAWRPVRRLRA
jgi:hypothetical protein